MRVYSITAKLYHLRYTIPSLHPLPHNLHRHEHTQPSRCRSRTLHIFHHATPLAFPVTSCALSHPFHAPPLSQLALQNSVALSGSASLDDRKEVRRNHGTIHTARFEMVVMSVGQRLRVCVCISSRACTAFASIYWSVTGVFVATSLSFPPNPTHTVPSHAATSPLQYSSSGASPPPNCSS